MKDQNDIEHGYLEAKEAPTPAQTFSYLGFLSVLVQSWLIVTGIIDKDEFITWFFFVFFILFGIVSALVHASNGRQERRK